MKNFQFRSAIQYFIVGLIFSISPGMLGQNPEPASVNYPNVKNDIETVRATIEAYENGNWEQLRTHMNDDAMVYNLGSFDSLTVDQTVNYWTKGRESAIPKISEDGIWLGVAVSEGPREGNWILHWGNNTLTYPNGETISFPYHLATLMKDKKIYRIYFYYDNGRIIRDLGYSIDPPLRDDDDNDEDDMDDLFNND